MAKSNLKILYVEDEQSYREELVQRLSSKLDVVLVSVGDFSTKRGGGETAQQFRRWLQAKLGTQKIDGVILDSDLSEFGNGISKEMLLAVFRSMGLPVCRYSKRTQGTTSEVLKHHANLASEGASSIWVPSELLNGDKAEFTQSQDHLVSWLEAAFSGFSEVQKKYSALANDGKAMINPAVLLARILDAPNMELDFLGYTGASLFFFGDHLSGPDEDEEANQSSGQTEVVENAPPDVSATRLGYWLYNYIISFPGPILNIASTAAFLGVESGSIEPDAFASAMQAERYMGPFSGCQPLFLRAKLEALLLETGLSGVELLNSRNVQAKAIYQDDPYRSGVYCIATNASIKSEDGIGPIDFIPGGASELCRISKKAHRRWMPWL